MSAFAGFAPTTVCRHHAVGKDSVPIWVAIGHPSLLSHPQVNPNLALFLTSPSDPKRCLAEFSPLPQDIVYRTIVLMQETLNSPIALSQSRTKNEPVWYKTLQNVTQCYTVTREPPDETMRLVSPDCHPTKGTGFRSIPSARSLGLGRENLIQGTPDLPDHLIRNAAVVKRRFPPLEE